MSDKDFTNVTERLIAALSYAGILFIIPLLAARRSAFSQFHAKQGMVLFVVEVIVSLIPFIGWPLAVAAFFAAVYAFIQAVQGHRWKIPYLHQFAERIQL